MAALAAMVPSPLMWSRRDAQNIAQASYTAKLDFVIQICNILVTYMLSDYVTAMSIQYKLYFFWYVTICTYSWGHNVNTYL